MSDEVDAKDRAVQAARERVAEIRQFYNHAALYGAVIAGLFVIDMFSGGGTWFHWPLIGWGIAVAMHGARTFDCLPWLSSEWEEDKVRELLDRDRESN